jgi:hypothetical protein
MAPLAEDIRKAYRNTRGQDDVDNIMEDLRDAFFIVKARKTDAPAINAAAELQTGPQKRTSAKPEVNTERTTEPVLKRSASINDWYKKSQ